ncbi:efflux RND transporter periplasmic adaptor subunit [Flavisolibacter ginsengisoli]|jgi:multidrug efflux pump subunit AcrA (membrane-fusion protein)|uniref:Barrel-sandwich domain of CusB or HlyD membrane-fusion n=1 Tax=Flavisolibacter ginsengisoli DSM 18119 TaxID=1121884 RepID=A0A1M4UCA6_9BACT|nr:HlyD family efflux transporter periplasmic adaptor subunit [Flavisolibacter ginsengisoli]SHE54369.1 Barrel-sandwich domain of CusB or HlyD membrane-fusion [Flavisolibacter ginsengisoli DSM 18119]
MQRINIYLATILLFFVSCKDKADTSDEAVAPETVQIPVTVTTIHMQTLNDYVDLNATSSFLQSNFIKASANGYLKSVKVHLGEMVHAGQQAFTLQTKESKALGNTINDLDPSFHFNGLISIKAAASGYIQELNHQPGDYVQDGEQLAVLTDSRSFGFVLNLPYELRQYVTKGKQLELNLPDGTHVNGVVNSILPNVDSASQTQQVLIRVNQSKPLPQNLIAKVRIIKAQKNNTPSLPKQAVLTDEAQSNFWVMKMIDSVTAVKVPIIKGMETADRVEILRPQFQTGDKILLTGNYGLADTARVKIVKSQE